MSSEEKLNILLLEEQRLLRYWPSMTPPSRKTGLGLDTTGMAAFGVTMLELNKAGANLIVSSLLGAIAYKGGVKVGDKTHRQYARKITELRKQRNIDLIRTQKAIVNLRQIIANEERAQQEAKERMLQAEQKREIMQKDNKRLNAQKDVFNHLEEIIPLADCKRNIYVTGKLGSGKTELLKTIFYKMQAESQADRNTALVFLDPHGDVAEELKALHLNKENDRLLYIDPYLQQGFTPVINPLDIKDKSTYSIDIHSQQIVKVFKELVANATLSNQMEALLKPCLFTLLLQDNPTLSDLQRFMNDDLNEDLVELGKQSPVLPHRAFFESQFYNPTFEKTKASIFVKIQSILNTPTFHNLVTGQSTIDLEVALNEGKVIIFNLSKGKMGEEASDAFGRFIIANLQSIAQRRIHQKKQDRKPCFVFIDECQNYITKSIDTILAETRKYGLHLVLANQYLHQIGTDTQQAILSNTAVKIAGQNNLDTFKKLAPNMGLKTDDLLALPQYQFFVKSGSNEPVLYASSDLLIRDETYVLDRQELKALDNYLINQSGLYRKLD